MTHLRQTLAELVGIVRGKPEISWKTHVPVCSHCRMQGNPLTGLIHFPDCEAKPEFVQWVRHV
jgi:hypothetical protein